MYGEDLTNERWLYNSRSRKEKVKKGLGRKAGYRFIIKVDSEDLPEEVREEITIDDIVAICRVNGEKIEEEKGKSGRTGPSREEKLEALVIKVVILKKEKVNQDILVLVVKEKREALVIQEVELVEGEIVQIA